MGVTFGVLGPVVAWDEAGAEIPLGGPRHRAVLARLLIAPGRVVPVSVLIDDLWIAPPENARGAVQTFVGALRKALEPDRPARTGNRLIVTQGDGYALHAKRDTIDAERFVEFLRGGGTPDQYTEALGWWRGPAYAEVAQEPWARPARARLSHLRLSAIEARARALLLQDQPEAAVPDLAAHVAEHPEREEGWRLLGLALYRSGRQEEALDTVRAARRRLADELGLDPGPELARLEHDILTHAEPTEHTDPTEHTEPTEHTAPSGWASVAANYARLAPADQRAELRTTLDLLRRLAVTGGSGLVAAREQRLAAIAEAEKLGDAELTARVVGAYDVPALWSRSDDERQAAAVVEAAERTAAALPEGAPSWQRIRLLATVAIESRGLGRGWTIAREAEEAARRGGDPALLAFALNAVFLQSFYRAGLCRERDGIGAELIALGHEHDLESYEILGHLIRLQALSGLGDWAAADLHDAEVTRLAERFGSPLVTVFTTWYRALRAGHPPPADSLRDAGMPGLTTGLVALARLAAAVREGKAAPVGDYGPHAPWARPLVLIDEGRRNQAALALRATPPPPPDHWLEAHWCLTARAAAELGDEAMATRARKALTPAAHEQAGAGSGLLTFGPVGNYLS